MTPYLLCPIPQHQHILEISTGKYFLIGQQSENPLLLLGQYSDQELDEQSNENPNNAIVESSLADTDDEVKGPLPKECEGMIANSDRDIPAVKVEQLVMERDTALLDDFQNLLANNIGESEVTVAGGLCKEMDLTEKVSVPGTSNIQVSGDGYSGWKMVLHDESNQYYYWNVETGETSWDVPDVLANRAELTCEQKAVSVCEGKEAASLETHESRSTLVEVDDSSMVHTVDESRSANLIPKIKETLEHEIGMGEQNGGYEGELLADTNGAPDLDQIGTKKCSVTNSDPCHETSSFGNHQSSQQSGDAPLGNGNLAGSRSDEYRCEKMANEEHEMRTDFSSGLVRLGECLLEKLKSLKRLDDHLQGHEQTSKYLLEVEIRLSDMKLLSSFGSSLLPFWEHCERQLKRLEGVISNDVNQISEFTQLNEVAVTGIAVINEEEKPPEIMIENETEGNDKVVFCSENSPASIVGPSSEVQKYSESELPNNVAIVENVAPVEYPTASLGDTGENGEKINDSAIPAVFAPKSDLHFGEDVDMDVDMEVEDTIPASNPNIGDALGTKYFNPLEQSMHFNLPEQSIQQNPPVEYPYSATEDGFSVPPPPDEEWIPPPPPDNELVPPPPPDEPPEPPCPPPLSYSETVQPLSFTEQYNVSYTDPSFEYYGHAIVDVPNGNIYGHAEGLPVAVPHQPMYYEMIPNTYTDTVPVIVNPADPTAYYDIKGGTVTAMPVVGSAESSRFHSESGPVAYESLAADQVGFIDAVADVSCSSLPSMKVDVSAFGTGITVATSGAPTTSTSVQVPGTNSLKEIVPEPSIDSVASAASVAATSATAKVQSKVLRSKKRTIAVAPSLRSNKKVSSLVDKWKAAKEELHEDDEDEPENAYEILEKKRQREIEEWRAQQIASGGAKDNANFQPLGGDWRERVKRRRAQLTRETVQTPPEVQASENQQPNLTDLSRDLPSGWQAYWDESSKQVYYGNTATSKTTWTRPTK